MFTSSIEVEVLESGTTCSLPDARYSPKGDERYSPLPLSPRFGLPSPRSSKSVELGGFTPRGEFLGCFTLSTSNPTQPCHNTDRRWELSPVQWNRAENARLVLEDANSDDDAVIEAARVLADISRFAEAYAPTLRRWIHHPEPEVRRVVAWAMGQLGLGACSVFASDLVERLGDSDPGVQICVQGLLKNTGPAGAIALTNKIVDSDGAAASLATDVLREMKAAGVAAVGDALRTVKEPLTIRRLVLALAAPQLQKYLPPHLEVLASVMSNSSDKVALATLARLLGTANDAAAPHAAALVKLLEFPDATVQANALEALGRIGSSAAAHTPAVTVLAKGADPNMQLLAVKAMGKIGAAALKKDPMAHFSDESWRPSDEGIVVLTRHLNHYQEDRVLKVIESLKLMGSFGAAIISSQLFVGTQERRDIFRDSLVELSGSWGGWDAVDQSVSIGAAALRCHLGHKDPRARIRVCEAMGRCGPIARGHIDTLMSIMEEDPDLRVREAARSAIGLMGDRKTGFETGESINNSLYHLLQDPKVVANSVPKRERQSAQKMAELMTTTLDQVQHLVKASTLQLPGSRAPFKIRVKLAAQLWIERMHLVKFLKRALHVCSVLKIVFLEGICCPHSCCCNAV